MPSGSSGSFLNTALRKGGSTDTTVKKSFELQKRKNMPELRFSAAQEFFTEMEKSVSEISSRLHVSYGKSL